MKKPTIKSLEEKIEQLEMEKRIVYKDFPELVSAQIKFKEAKEHLQNMENKYTDQIYEKEREIYKEIIKLKIQIKKIEKNKKENNK